MSITYVHYCDHCGANDFESEKDFIDLSKFQISTKKSKDHSGNIGREFCSIDCLTLRIESTLEKVLEGGLK